LQRAHRIYLYLNKQTNDNYVALIFPMLAEKLIKFTTLYAKKLESQKAIRKTSKAIIRWYGLDPLLKAI